MFYDNLKKACDMNNMSISTALKKCGRSSGIASTWKSGVVPKSDVILELSNILNVSADFLLKGKNSKESLSTEEKNLIHQFKQLTPINRIRIAERIKTMLEEQEYTANIAAFGGDNQQLSITEAQLSEAAKALIEEE